MELEIADNVEEALDKLDYKIFAFIQDHNNYGAQWMDVRNVLYDDSPDLLYHMFYYEIRDKV